MVRTARFDVPVLGGVGVDAIVHVPGLAIPAGGSARVAEQLSC